MKVEVLPGQAALDAVIEVLFAGDHITLEDLVQRDFSAAQPDDFITHLQKNRYITVQKPETTLVTPEMSSFSIRFLFVSLSEKPFFL